MNSTNWYVKKLAVAVVALSLLGVARAEEKGKSGGKPSKDEAKPVIVQIDLNKLPPDLAKQLLIHLAKTKGTLSAVEKGEKKGKGGDREQQGQHEDEDEKKGKKGEGAKSNKGEQ